MTESYKKVSVVIIALIAAISMMIITTSSASASYQSGKEFVCSWSSKHNTWFVTYSKPSDDNFKYEGPKTLDPRVSSKWCNDQRSVTPEEPTFVDPSCDNDGVGSFTVPGQTGVFYTVDDEVVTGTVPAEYGDTVVVVANAEEGWFLAKTDSENGWSWGHEFPSEEECEVVVVEDEDDSEVLAVATTQVTTTPTGSANAGGAGSTALVGLVASSALLGLGVAGKKFLV